MVDCHGCVPPRVALFCVATSCAECRGIFVHLGLAVLEPCQHIFWRLNYASQHVLQEGIRQSK